MTTMIAEIYEALRDAGASEEKAQAAAKAVANYDDRFNRIDKKLITIEGEQKVMKWMLAMVLAVLILPMLKDWLI